MQDLIAEGMTRESARAAAAKMLREDDEDGDEQLCLPRSELPLIRLIMAVRHQWRLAGGGMAGSFPVAFDLPAVDVAARWLGLTPDARLMDGLSIIEAEALKLMRNQR